MAGLHPATGRPIGSSRVTVAAYDLTFSAPKSASVLFALGGPDEARRIVDVDEAAVAGGLAYLEQHAVSAVRRDVVIPTSGMVAGQFTHAVSRNGDPHLHSHVVMANLVHGVDGRWTACDRRGLDAHRQAACSVYEAHLRAALAALGRALDRAAGPQPRDRDGGARAARRALLAGGRHPPHAYKAGTRSARVPRVAWAATRPGKVQAPTSRRRPGLAAAGVSAPAPRPSSRAGIAAGPTRACSTSTASPACSR